MQGWILDRLGRMEKDLPSGGKRPAVGAIGGLLLCWSCVVVPILAVWRCWIQVIVKLLLCWQPELRGSLCHGLFWVGAIGGLVLGWGQQAELAAAVVVMEDGRIITGKLGPPIPTLGNIARTVPESDAPAMIVFLDDDLRRIFLPRRQVREVRQDETGQLEEKFRIWQRVLRGGPTVQTVGPILRIQPFDEYGRRILTMATARGPVDIIQGITELTPRWAKVEGISHVWDMRIATSTIPQETLAKILAKQIDPKNPEHGKRLARFYLQAERYEEAIAQLQALLKQHPEDAALRQQVEAAIRDLRQLAARRLLEELRLRRQAGQHQLVIELLKKFPSEGLSGEILQEVREMLEDYQKQLAQRQEVLELLDRLLPEIKQDKYRPQLQAVLGEIRQELNLNTLGRLTPFRQLASDASLQPEEKMALAISGWLMGADGALPRLPIALSVYEVRNLVRQYLIQQEKPQRDQILQQLSRQEGATAERVARVLAHMKPPLESQPMEGKPGYYVLEVPGVGREPAVRYYVQLPPEYDPYRRYPAIMTLRGAGTTAELQVDWWAGEWHAQGWRMGQAARHGYIVIAPDWPAEHQKQYQYSLREHAAVLQTLRDACRRFSIDTDRVFLTGHSMGGDAAWDIGLAHPDLWAGVIPIVAQADKYIALYWENAALVPFYFVCGELDGGKMAANARDLDRYLNRGYNVTVVEYLGRGHEDFYDEILRLFDWMGRLRRNFFPKEFVAVSMRPWDNFFWWVELEGYPSRSMVDPTQWPPPSGYRPIKTEASLTANNGVRVQARSAKITVWLAPEMVDFQKQITVVVNGFRAIPPNRVLQPDLALMLEDVRLRADRQHPFWAKLTVPTGRALETSAK
ncbi:MAG: tetratricopeptide repeat protein [Thermoguttaceae bacterium]|nr:tetratricopeptide repeat protein [Thermoguttaceae bacterium]MDW8038014.1 tetratricopeptide repeat protein [Thermoguttaceae bacterium]